MIQENSIVGELIEIELIKDSQDSLVAGVPLYEAERRFLQQELKKTVREFLESFRALVVELCHFHHEKPGSGVFFTACTLLWKNMACWHPRLIRAKFEIALHLLLLTKKISREESQKIRTIVYGETESLGHTDRGAEVLYRKEYINPASLAKLGTEQEEKWNTLLAIRDNLILRLDEIALAA